MLAGELTAKHFAWTTTVCLLAYSFAFVVLLLELVKWFLQAHQLYFYFGYMWLGYFREATPQKTTRSVYLWVPVSSYLTNYLTH